MRRRFACVFCLSVSGALSCGPAEKPVDPHLVAGWMDALYGAVRAEQLSPPVASRLYAYAAVALYEGIAPPGPQHRSLAGQLNGLEPLPRPDPGRSYDWPTVAVTAETTVLHTLLREARPATLAALASLADSQLAVRPGTAAAVRSRSVAYGGALGGALAAWAAVDGFAQTRGLVYVPPRGRGLWVNTATPDQYRTLSLSAVSSMVALQNPADTLAPALAGERALLIDRPKPAGARTLPAANVAGITEPFWGRLRPFVVATDTECAALPPPRYANDTVSSFYHQARAVYDTARFLTEDQRQIALFWADNPGQTGTPPGHWVRILSQVVEERRLGAAQAAETFALMAVGMADAFIAAWREKFHSNVMRPVTYIRRRIDPTWYPLIVTPSFPEYPSAHSVESGVAATILTQLLGTVAFVDSTNLSIGFPPKPFPSFARAAAEVAVSRLYGGIHYPVSIANGLTQGQCLGRLVLERIHTRGSS